MCVPFVEPISVSSKTVMRCVVFIYSKMNLCVQTTRGEFENDGSPDLNKDVYLQDIHCVSSLCKAYFRELPNPLLTYQLYDKFAVSSSDTQTFHSFHPHACLCLSCKESVEYINQNKSSLCAIFPAIKLE